MPRFIQYLQRVCADQFAIVSGLRHVFAPTSPKPRLFRPVAQLQLHPVYQPFWVKLQGQHFGWREARGDLRAHLQAAPLPQKRGDRRADSQRMTRQDFAQPHLHHHNRDINSLIP